SDLLRITSGNEFEEGREVALTIIPNTNTSNAQFLIANSEIYTGRELTLFLEPNEPFYTELLVSDSEGIFDYPDLGLVIRPNGVRSEMFASGPQVYDSLYFSVYYRKPVSTVNIDKSDGSWFINSIDPDPSLKEAENYVFKLDGYDVEGDKSNLSYLEVEYKRANEEQLDWKKIPRLLEDQNGLDSASEKIGIKELAEFYEKNKRIYQEPTFNFNWDLELHKQITGDEIIDGNYLVRAVAVDDNGLFHISDPYSGTIDRVAPQLADQPEPKDLIYSIGDNISLSFDDAIDQGLFDAYGYAELIIYDLNGVPIDTLRKGEDDQLTVVANGSGIDIEIGDLAYYNDGHTVEMSVSGIEDFYGNSTNPDTISWSFKQSS
ncbi:MAG: Ig-like domain-containing protein, partial [Bacteroidota bacterium]